MLPSALGTVKYEEIYWSLQGLTATIAPISSRRFISFLSLLYSDVVKLLICGKFF